LDGFRRSTDAIIDPMTDPGLPFAGGAAACPFVAFEDERDERSTSPDHRHRCYAEPTPAPRALAHQEAYCLSSAFPVCPTFQDWARRESARTRGGAAPSEPIRARAVEPDAEESAGPPRRSADLTIDEAEAARRNPPRDWAAPPPWLDDRADPHDGWPIDDRDAPEDGGRPPTGERPPADPGARGLSGSMADRFAGPGDARSAEPHAAPEPPRRAPGEPPRDHHEADGDEADGGGFRSLLSDRRPKVGDARPRRARDLAPNWERPRRYEAYPTLRSRLSLPSPSPILLGAAAVALAAVLLFLAPGFLGFGSPDPGGATPTPTAGPPQTPTPPPTPTPAPTPQTYVVQPGDTLSKIATQFGLTLAQVLEANPQIENADTIQIGDEIIIPTALPTTLGGATEPPASIAPGG
jgi:nucleoid-associated protein YgaU